MTYRARMPIVAATAMLAGGLLLPLAGAVMAQNAPQPSPAAPAENSFVPATRPDVQIVAIVSPTGNYAVSSVYPGQVPEKVAQGRVTRLLKLTGWKAIGRHFSDASAPSNMLRDKNDAKLSAASFQTPENIARPDGTIDWEPFLRAFGDLRHVRIICFTPQGYTYRGPVKYQNDRVAFFVAPGQGTVTLTANLLKPEPDPAAFGLPKYAEATPAPRKQVAANTAQNRQAVRVIGLGIAVVLAIGVALLIYGVTSRYTARG